MPPCYARSVVEHELTTFLMQDLSEMKSEYERIRLRSLEDPGTAGDEGEEAWAAILRDWLPENYQIRLKGRILASNGAAGPQVDIVVLRPGYPKRLLDKKLYLAGGVAAAFECKNTLKSTHIEAAWKTAGAIDYLVGIERGRSPFRSLVPSIYFGLLAHGHSWDREGSDPLRQITSKLQELVASTGKIREVLSLLCVANLASWDVLRMSYDGPGLLPADIRGARKKLLGIDSDEPVCAVQYSIASSDVHAYAAANPVGVLVAKLVGRLAFEDSALHPLSQYFFAAGMGGNRGIPVIAKQYPLSSHFDDEVIGAFPNALTNGLNGSEWALVFNF